MSSSDTREARVETLKATQSVRKQETLDKVNKAIERLQKMGAKINFHSLAREANVSVPYLYKYPEIKERIANLRQQQTSMPSSLVNQPPVTQKAHSQVVAKLKERIVKLEQDNLELKRKNEALAGQVYRVHSLQEQVERQKELIITLEQRLKDANQQITSSKVVPINTKMNQEISEKIKQELDLLGISLNPTLIGKIKASTTEIVLGAIEALKDQLTKTNIDNPGGWLARAIEHGWTVDKSIPQQKPTKEPPKIYTPPEENKETISLDKLTAISSIFKKKDE